jgi:hypothetical protein
MSSNIELVERFADAFNRRDLDRLLELGHPPRTADLRWRETGDVATSLPVRAVFTLDGGSVVRWEGRPTDEAQP